MDEITLTGKNGMWSCVVNDKIDLNAGDELSASKTYFNSDINIAV
jgi:hypothetical protein